MTSTLIVITGPTATGKSDLSLQVALYFQTGILSADSRQIYREMKIGTAVPAQKELDLVRHYFVGSRSIMEDYNAGQFETDAIALLEKLFQEHRVVIMTGGSMLYLDAVCRGIDDLPSVDPEVRTNLITRFENEGIESLRLQLKNMDPVYYSQVDLHNPKRLLHALEMCLMSGKPYSELRTSPHKKRPFQILKIGLTCERAILYRRINERVDRMIAAGLEEEVRQLLPCRSVNALNTVGYREWFDFFDGKTTREETIGKIKSNTRRYARKQMTWFRKDHGINWFDIADTDKVIPSIEKKLR